MVQTLKRRLLLLCRTLHIYLSMLSLLAILFFAATGFLLNHPTWFDLDVNHKAERSTVIPEDIASTQDKLELVEHLRAHESARGVVKSYSRLDDRTEIHFSGPGRTMHYTVYHATGDTHVELQTRNALAWLGDLHKAKYTGQAWPLVVDATAWLLIVVSLTGLVLWVTLAKRRTVGLVALGACIAAIVVVLAVLVP